MTCSSVAEIYANNESVSASWTTSFTNAEVSKYAHCISNAQILGALGVPQSANGDQWEALDLVVDGWQVEVVRDRVAFVTWYLVVERVTPRDSSGL